MSFKRICSVTINGKRWSVGFGYPGKSNGIVNDGICLWEKRRIVIHAERNGRSRSLAETIVHEIAHARLGPDISEEAVDDIGRISAVVLAKAKALEPDKY
jgi:hypothetical protein